MSWSTATAQPTQLNFGLLWRQFSAEAKPKEDPKKVDSLEITEESYKAITDQIPQRPMGVVEGTSYSLVIFAAFAFLAFIVYQFITTLLLEPLPYQCYNAAFDRLKEDPRITVRLGGDVRAWGGGGGSRGARQQIPHTIYKTEDGVEHVRLQFHMGGSAGVALVSADMFKGADGAWQYLYLVVDVASQGSQQAQRLFIVTP